MASKLAERLKLSVIHFDQHFWEPGGFNKKRDKQVLLQEIALNHATAVIFLDKPWAECKRALLDRGSESSRQADPNQAEESFQKLLQWAEN